MNTATPDLQTAHPWLPQVVRIAEVQEETPGVRTYRLDFVDEQQAAAYRFLPGQFNMLYLPGIGEAAISISSTPGEPLLHTVRQVGSVTGALAAREIGDQVALRGPFGTAWPLDQCRGLDLVIAAGGIGLAPLRPVLRHVAQHRDDFGRVTLLYGARTRADLLYAGEYDAWRAADIEVVVTVDLGDGQWQGHIGVVPALFYQLQLDSPRTRVYTCGPEIMMRFAVQESLAHQVAAEHVFLSMERNMSCAMGFCGHCQLGPAFVCKDGPVLAWPAMEPYMHLEDL